MRPEEPSHLPERAVWFLAIVFTVAFGWLFSGMANAFGYEETLPLLFVLILFYLLMVALGWLARRRRFVMAKRLAEYDALMARLATTSDER